MNAKHTTKTKASGKKKATPHPPTRGVRLKGGRDVARLLNKLINQVLTAKEEEEVRAQNKLRTVAYALTNLLKSLELGDLQQRITKIEEHIRCQQSGAESKKRK